MYKLIEYNCRSLTRPHKKPFVSEIKVLSEVDHDDTYAADQGLDATPYYVYAKTVIFYPLNKECKDFQMITIKSRGCSGVYADFEIIANEEIEQLKEILTSFNVDMDDVTIIKNLPGPQDDNQNTVYCDRCNKEILPNEFVTHCNSEDHNNGIMGPQS